MYIYVYIYVYTYIYIYIALIFALSVKKLNQPSQTNFQSIVYIYMNINKYIKSIKNIEI